mgnify:CR=1 FL=1
MDPWILRLESWKKKYRNLNPPVSRDSGGFWFLDWNESGFETGPRAGVMLLKITLRQLLRKSREPA